MKVRPSSVNVQVLLTSINAEERFAHDQVSPLTSTQIRDLDRAKVQVQRKAVKEIASEEHKAISPFNQITSMNTQTGEGSSVQVDSAPMGGGFFTRHLRRSVLYNLRHSDSNSGENVESLAYRLAVFSSFLSQADGVECVLKQEKTECENGYEMSAEMQIEWRYLLVKNMLPPLIKVRVNFLHE